MTKIEAHLKYIMPEPDTQKNQIIQVSVASANFEDVVFKIKQTTRFEKLFKTYLQKYNLLDQKTVWFIYEGETIQAEQTPEQIKLKDQDTIECVIEQEGGMNTQHNFSN